LVGVLIVFGFANYAITQSLWTTLVNTAICAVLIQLGYFAAILFLVWRAGPSHNQADSLSHNDRSTIAGKEGKAASVPGVRRSPLP
jgi:hypothetical protein